MEAFESLCERVLREAGYWVIPGIYIELDRKTKESLDEEIAAKYAGRPIFKNFPRTQLDLVAYKPARHELLIIECKSYLDSKGVSVKDFPFSSRRVTAAPNDQKAVAGFKRYKLFQHPEYLDAVSKQLIKNLTALSMLNPGCVPRTKLVLFSGKVADKSTIPIRKQFAIHGLKFVSPQVIIRGLIRLRKLGYHNDPIVMTAKLLLSQ